MEFRLHVALGKSEDAGDTVPWLRNLGEDLAGLHEVEIERLPDALPGSTKGASGLAGLRVRVPTTRITALVQVVRAWVARTRRTVEISAGGDILKISDARGDRQDREIEAWFLHHASGMTHEAQPSMHHEVDPASYHEDEPASYHEDPGMEEWDSP
jgi:hypothetical protein